MGQASPLTHGTWTRHAWLSDLILRSPGRDREAAPFGVVLPLAVLPAPRTVGTQELGRAAFCVEGRVGAMRAVIVRSTHSSRSHTGPAPDEPGRPVSGDPSWDHRVGSERP